MDAVGEAGDANPDRTGGGEDEVAVPLALPRSRFGVVVGFVVGGVLLSALVASMWLLVPEGADGALAVQVMSVVSWVFCGWPCLVALYWLARPATELVAAPDALLYRGVRFFGVCVWTKRFVLPWADLKDARTRVELVPIPDSYRYARSFTLELETVDGEVRRIPWLLFRGDIERVVAEIRACAGCPPIAATESGASEPGATESAATESAATEPAATEPAATEPAATESTAGAEDDSPSA